MAITAALIVTACMDVQKVGPVDRRTCWQLVPFQRGHLHVFSRSTIDAALIARRAGASLPMDAATIFLGLAYVVYASRSASPYVASTVAVGGIMLTFDHAVRSQLDTDSA